MKIKPAYVGLKADSETNTYPRKVPNAHFSYVQPEAVDKPHLLCWSNTMGKLMGIEPSESWVSTLAGNSLQEGMKPVATRYGGHQFGHWAGQLGDGRAMTLGRIENGSFEFELQLKGAGLTPYSRTADGRAVLRSSLREFICSEAMASLGVPTTRALSLVTTGESVVRDMFYDGNPEAEDGAICSRVAPSFLRLGHFQIHAALNEREELQQLIDYTLANFYPGKSVEEFFFDVVNKTAFLITEWYRVGFVHGVMNTDNLSIHGLTIDYGPYGWLDVFDPDWTPNTTDFQNRRYRFMNQHNIAYWNLARFAEAFTLLGYNFESSLSQFPSLFKGHMSEMMRRKLGLRFYNDDLVNRTFHLLTDLQGDMTLFYRSLMRFLQGRKPDFKDCFYKELSSEDEVRIEHYLKNWEHLLDTDAEAIMEKANPVFVPRNYIVQEALDGLHKGDDQILRRIEKAMLEPYKETTDTLHWFKKRPDWAASRPGCSTLSCSS